MPTEEKQQAALLITVGAIVHSNFSQPSIWQPRDWESVEVAVCYTHARPLSRSAFSSANETSRFNGPKTLAASETNGKNVFTFIADQVVEQLRQPNGNEAFPNFFLLSAIRLTSGAPPSAIFPVSLFLSLETKSIDQDFHFWAHSQLNGGP